MNKKSKLFKIGLVYKIFSFFIILVLDFLFEDFDYSTKLILNYEGLS